MLRFLFRVGLPLIAAAWLLHVPVYEGYDNFSPLAFILPVTKLFFRHIPRAIEGLGLGTRHEVVRTTMDFMQGLAPAIASTTQAEDLLFGTVKVRVYWPEKFDKSASKKLPGLVFIHGGGCVIGTIKGYDILVRQLTADLAVVAVSVEYRLAPEHIFPAALDDSVLATEYFMDNAAKFGVDNTKIGIMGDSAGGNLAAAVAQTLQKKKSRPPLKLQVLVYPVMQMVDVHTPSYQQNAHDPILSRDTMVWFFAHYAFGHQKYSQAIEHNNHTSPKFKEYLAKGPMNHKLVAARFRSQNYVEPKLDFGDVELWAKVKDVLSNPAYSPLLSDDLNNLPPAIVVTCEYDVLRDEGLMYASRLEQAEVPVTRMHFDKGFHGILSFITSLPEARDVYEKIVAKMQPLLN